MRIRHLDSPNGFYAAFTLPYQPFAVVEPLLYFGLVARDGEDEVVGFLVSDDKVVAADEVEGFARYWRPRTAESDKEYQALFSDLYQQGYDAFIEANPHMAPPPAAPQVPTTKRQLRVRPQE